LPPNAAPEKISTTDRIRLLPARIILSPDGEIPERYEFFGIRRGALIRLTTVGTYFRNIVVECDLDWAMEVCSGCAARH